MSRRYQRYQFEEIAPRTPIQILEILSHRYRYPKFIPIPKQDTNFLFWYKYRYLASVEHPVLA